jgi:hypothetical protein
LKVFEFGLGDLYLKHKGVCIPLIITEQKQSQKDGTDKGVNKVILHCSKKWD